MPNPAQRITIPAMLKHPWVAQNLPAGVASMNDNLPPASEGLQVGRGLGGWCGFVVYGWLATIWKFLFVVNVVEWPGVLGGGEKRKEGGVGVLEHDIKRARLGDMRFEGLREERRREERREGRGITIHAVLKSE